MVLTHLKSSIDNSPRDTLEIINSDDSFDIGEESVANETELIMNTKLRKDSNHHFSSEKQQYQFHH